LRALEQGTAARFEYVATIAECIDPTLPDPVLCKLVSGTQQLAIDMRDSGTTNP